MNKFSKKNKPADQANDPPPRAASSRKRSGGRWKGVDPGRGANEMMNAGFDYHLEFVRGNMTDTKGKDPYQQMFFSVVETDDPGLKKGSEVIVMSCSNPKSEHIALGEYLQFVMGLTGLTEAQYTELDDDGLIYDAEILGEENEFSESGHTLKGRHVYVKCLQGKDDGRGGYYRKYNVEAPDESDQPEGVTNFHELVD